jgi:hypothetical protein
MSSHIKDLKAGMNMASSQVSPAQKVEGEKSSELNPVAPPQEEVLDMVGENPKKGVNWLLIGGVAVGAFVIYKLIKK